MLGNLPISRGFRINPASYNLNTLLCNEYMKKSIKQGKRLYLLALLKRARVPILYANHILYSSVIFLSACYHFLVRITGVELPQLSFTRTPIKIDSSCGTPSPRGPGWETPKSEYTLI